MLTACGTEQPADLDSAARFTAVPAGEIEESSGADSKPDPTAAAETVTATTTARERSSEPKNDSSQSGCASVDNPLASRNALTVINVGDPFYFDIVNDKFDACATLSYNVIDGIADGRSGQGVVFFINGRPVSEPQPLVENKIVSVTMLDDSSAEVDYQISHNGRSSRGYAIFEVDGSTLDIPERNLGEDANAAGFQLDVSGL